MNDLFTDDEAIAYVNLLLEEEGKRTRVVSVDRTQHERAWLFKDAKGGRIVTPIAEFAPGLIGVRSILRPSRPQSGINWMVNGQATKGTKEVAFYGESGPRLVSTKDRLREYAESITNDPKVSDRIYEKYADMMEDEVVSVMLPNEGHRKPLIDEDTPSVKM